jgi:uncharacterized protein (TIGR00375 family)
MIRADLHFHSKYSRATSPRNDIKNISLWAKNKGIDLLGTTDFTHPLWLKELKQNLKPLKEDNKGTIYSYNNINFIPSVEVSTIYEKNGKVRKVHHVILAPNFETVEQINDVLGRRTNLNVDGRPIFSMSCAELIEKITCFSDYVELIPAHCWTPWFGVFGSKSGFDSLKEAYEDQTHKIHALETGLSSDILMNWRLSTLDKYTLVSNSDAHSPENLGRELTVFDINENHLIYSAIIEHIRNKKVSTVEFYPEEGKYHLDGHRKCNVCFKPSESKKHNNICPVCNKKLTLGVLHRIDDLADREPGFIQVNGQKYEYLIQLREIIAQAFKVNKLSVKVSNEYFNIIKAYENEWNALHAQDLTMMSPVIADAVYKVQQKKITIKPGYDGVYGVVLINKNNKEKKNISGQQTLFGE